MTQHQLRIARFVLAVAFVGLGIWALAQGKSGEGATFLVIGVAWLLIAATGDRVAAMRDRRRADPQA